MRRRRDEELDARRVGSLRVVTYQRCIELSRNVVERLLIILKALP